MLGRHTHRLGSGAVWAGCVPGTPCAHLRGGHGAICFLIQTDGSITYRTLAGVERTVLGTTGVSSCSYPAAQGLCIDIRTLAQVHMVVPAGALPRPV